MLSSSEALTDTFTEGPCPAIVIGDCFHFRTILINAKTKSISLVDPFGHGFLPEVKLKLMDLYSQDISGAWLFTVHMQYDSCNCGTWAIWKWMQYWSQGEVTTPFETWFQQSFQEIPSGKSLRSHYQDQMQAATTKGADDKSGFERSKDMSAVRMANKRNLQEPRELHTRRSRHILQVNLMHGTVQMFKHTENTPSEENTKANRQTSSVR